MEGADHMKQSVLHFRITSALLSFLLVLSSTGGITSPLTVRAASTEPSAELYDSQEVPNSDYSIGITSESVRQVQHLADVLYEKNLDNFSSRNGGFTWDTERKKRSWTYYNGIMMDAYLMLDDYIPNEVRTYPAVNSFYDANITYSGTSAAVDTTGNADNYYRENELDSIPPVRAMFDLLRSDIPSEDEREKYRRMILRVYDLMTNQYPTVEGTDGNFRHKHGNVSSSWNSFPIALDGLYMATPFFMELANAVENGYIDAADGEIVPDELYGAAAARMLWIGEHLYDPQTGLYHHGWGPQAGLNGQFWLRAVGWYAAALSDVISMLPARFADQRKQLIEIEAQLFDGMLHYQDPENGMWYNIINRDGTLKRSSTYNLPESSGTVLIAYAMLKSYSEGWIGDSYCEAGLRAFNGTVRTQLDGDSFRNIYLSSGVGTTAESYLVNGYKVNEAKGVASLMMAACFANQAAARYHSDNNQRGGDINADGVCSSADLLLLQKWLLGVSDITLSNWKNGDMNSDEQLDARDLTLMKRALL